MWRSWLVTFLCSIFTVYFTLEVNIRSSKLPDNIHRFLILAGMLYSLNPKNTGFHVPLISATLIWKRKKILLHFHAVLQLRWTFFHVDVFACVRRSQTGKLYAAPPSVWTIEKRSTGTRLLGQTLLYPIAVTHFHLSRVDTVVHFWFSIKTTTESEKIPFVRERYYFLIREN